MRYLLFIFVFLLHGLCSAQKRTPNLIPDDAVRKVQRAKKLYNNLKIFAGEKILKDLVKEHPNECYYEEALIRMQRQVLRYIVAAQGELQSMGGQHLSAPNDSSSVEEDEDIDAPDSAKVAKKELNEDEDLGLSWNGLDRGKAVKKVEKKTMDDKDIVLTDAVMSIDSNLLKPELDENGDTVVKLTKKEKALQKQMKVLNDLAQIPYEGYLQDFIRNARTATLRLTCLDSTSHFLREFLVDSLDLDWGAPEEAQELFEQGVFLFKEKNYVAAAKQMEQAVDVYPNYFKARMKLAETYYYMNKDSSANQQFKYLIHQFPDRPEPFEKISDHLYELGLYEDAIAAIIDAISIYPEHSYFKSLQQIALKKGVVFNSQWIKRDVFPLQSSTKYEEIIAKEKTAWWQYQSVKSGVVSLYDSVGLLQPNDKTKEPYLEVYAWKKMLNNTGRDTLLFARAMEKIGYLDCYVLITLFHQDLYMQYKDFSRNNKEKIKKYFYLLLNWENKKFDKLRKEVGYPIVEKEKEKVKGKENANGKVKQQEKK